MVHSTSAEARAWQFRLHRDVKLGVGAVSVHLINVDRMQRPALSLVLTHVIHSHHIGQH